MAIGLFITLIFFTILFTAWRKFIKSGPVYRSGVSLEGKTVLITGGSGGLGKATAIDLAKKKARVIIASRNEDKALDAIAKIKVESKNNSIHFMKLDLTDFDDVRRFVKSFVEHEPRLDILVNLAGVITSDNAKNGHNAMFATNVLGPFLLTNLLLPILQKTSSENRVRIVNISSDAYVMAEIDFENLAPKFDENSTAKTILSHYCATKLMTVYITTQLNTYLRGKDPESRRILTYVLHPGTAKTDLGATFAQRSLFWIFLRWAALGLMARPTFFCAQTIIFCCVDPDIEEKSGEYFADMKRNELWPNAKIPGLGKKLWKKFEHLTALQ